MGERFTPLTIALLLAWILCVCVHEFSHALVAYFGGDRSVREKGYLSLDPTRFIDPVFSLLIPAIVLLLGGLPLPGGAVRIDEGSLRSRRWRLGVSAAGPASNFLLFLLFAFVLHPSLGIVKATTDGMYAPWVYFVGALAYLNFVATVFNLLPVPPLDGYHLIEHQLSPETQWKLRQPQVSMMAFGALFMVFWVVPQVWIVFDVMMLRVTEPLGLPYDLMYEGFFYVVHGIAPDPL